MKKKSDWSSKKRNGVGSVSVEFVFAKPESRKLRQWLSRAYVLRNSSFRVRDDAEKREHEGVEQEKEDKADR